MKTLGFAQQNFNPRLALLCFLLYVSILSHAVYFKNSLLHSSKPNIITKVFLLPKKLQCIPKSKGKYSRDWVNYCFSSTGLGKFRADYVVAQALE